MGFQQAQIKAAKTRVYLPLTTATTVNNHPSCQECEVERLYILPTWSLFLTASKIKDALSSPPPKHSLHILPAQCDGMRSGSGKSIYITTVQSNCSQTIIRLFGKTRHGILINVCNDFAWNTAQLLPQTQITLRPAHLFHSHIPLNMMWIILMLRQEEYHFICDV